MSRPSKFLDPIWFQLIGSKIVMAGTFVSFAAAFYAIMLIHRAQLVAGIALGVAWLALHSILLGALHQRRVVRLPISIACTIAPIMAFIVYVFVLGV